MTRFLTLCVAGLFIVTSGTSAPLNELKSMVKHQQQQAFSVIGLGARTNNAKEMTGNGQIGQIWQKFMQQQISSRIPRKIGDEILAVYTDYQSDQNGDFTYLLGVKVSSIEKIPDGLIARQIPAGNYAVVTSEQGPVIQVVPRLWQRIWAMPPDELGGKRAFHSDYEVYDESAKDPQNAKVKVYVGLQ